MKTIRNLFTLVSVVCAFSGCSSDAPVDLGDDKTGRTAQGLAAYEGAWDGYAEAYKFASGSDRVRITLDAEGHGTIEVGDAPLIPPFSDPDIGYPTTDTFDLKPGGLDPTMPHEGHRYAVDAVLEGGRLRLGFWGADLQRPWCEAQTSYIDPGAFPLSHTCTAAGSSFGWNGDDDSCVDGDSLPVDCGFIMTCVLACACDANGCTTRRDPGTKLELDGALENGGTTLVGTFVLRDARVTVRLQRD